MDLLFPDLLKYFLIGSFSAALISILSFRFRLLTNYGAFASFILGTIIFSFGQLKWAIPLISFFVFSNIVSKFGKKTKVKFDSVFEKSSIRDFGQVFANGGAAGILVITNYFFPNDLLYLVYLGSLSAVCGDSFATEIGTMSNTPTYNILNLEKTKQGISGGISILGTCGAFVGTLIIALSALIWIHLNLIYYFCLIVFAGLTGVFFDSILGAAIQSQYKCKNCGAIIEKKNHCSEKTIYFRGIPFVNNDLVNFAASLAGSSIVYFINEIVN